MAETTHNPNITINITLDPSPVQRAGFGTVLHLVDEAAGTGNDLDGDRTARYTSLSEAQTAQTAGFITAEVLLAITALFSQRPKPADVLVGRVDTVAVETYSDALALVIADDPDFYGVTMDSRTAATQVALATTVEADDKRMMLVLQSSDSDWLTATVPAGYSTIDGNERSAVIYHDTDTIWADVAWLASRLVFDPDDTSAPFAGPVRSITAYSTPPTAAERLLAIANNANLGLPYGGENFYVDPGRSMNTRPLYEQLTADWFAARLEEDTSAEVVKYAARGEKIIVDKSGQSVIQGLIQARLGQGEQVGHFAVGQTESLPQDITTTDTTNQRMRWEVQGQLAVAARLFVYNVNFSTSPINDDA